MASSSKHHVLVPMVESAGTIQTSQYHISYQSDSFWKADPLQRRKKSIGRMGIAEVILGCLSMILAVAANGVAGKEAYEYFPSANYSVLSMTFYSQGLWGGLFVLISGVLGIKVTRKPTRSLYIANMTMAIITANVAGAAFLMSLTITLIFASVLDFAAVLVGIHSCIGVISISSTIVTIVHASFCCCCGICCNQNSEMTSHAVCIPQHDAAFMQQHQYVEANGQVCMVGNHPATVQSYVNTIEAAVVPTSRHLPPKLHGASTSQSHYQPLHS